MLLLSTNYRCHARLRVLRGIRTYVLHLWLSLAFHDRRRPLKSLSGLSVFPSEALGIDLHRREASNERPIRRNAGGNQANTTGGNRPIDETVTCW